MLQLTLIERGCGTMRKLTKSLLVVSTLAAAGSAGAAMMDEMSMTPRLGVDYQQTWVRGKDGFRDVFAKSFPGGDVYVGVDFTEYFGADLGYEWTARKKHSVTPANNSFFGIAAFNGSTVSSKVRLNGFYLDLNGYVPLDNCWRLIGSIGIESMKPKIDMRASGGTLTASQIAGIGSIKGKAKGLWRIGVGGEYLFTDMVGARVMARWKNTSRLRVEGDTNFAALQTLGVSNKPFKDAISLSLGLFVKF